MGARQRSGNNKKYSKKPDRKVLLKWNAAVALADCVVRSHTHTHAFEIKQKEEMCGKKRPMQAQARTGLARPAPFHPPTLRDSANARLTLETNERPKTMELQNFWLPEKVCVRTEA